MAFDGLVVRAVVHELQRAVGGRLHKIHQPNDHDLVFAIRTKGETLRLLISANPTYPRFHLTARPSLNPLTAPMFCMLLRKHCESGVIESIEQIGMERIVHIVIRQRDELGDTSYKRIIVEIMGRHSNIILADAGGNTVLEAIHRVTPAVSSHRIVAPGSNYVPPPEQQKQNPLITTKEEVCKLLSSGEQEETAQSLAKRLVNAYSGVSPLAARAITAAARPGQQGLTYAVADSFSETMRRIRDHEYDSNVAEEEKSEKTVFSVIPLDRIGTRTRTFASVSECLEFYYGDKAERDIVKQKTADLFRRLQNEKSKNEKKLEKLHLTLAEGEHADQYRIYGELLHASLHQIERGMEAIDVPNYYDENEQTITIPLDPLLSPSENAQRHFKKYQKLKNSLVVVNEQLQQTAEEIQYVEGLLQQLEGASLADIEEIRTELVQGGYIRDRSQKDQRKSKKNDSPRIHSFVSSEGIPIYVGKNNTQNDYITNRLARPSDTWLHTKDIPGSHVVIRSAEYSDQTLAEAANLAAYYSKGRQSSSVPVDYTLVKHVKKPFGAKPGFVIYEKQKTLFVTPDEELIEKCKPQQN